MDNAPQIPTLKDGKKPQLKIKGLQAGLSLLERLKQFKKKDLAFILAGLGTLLMAPLAEHFMMAPENGEADRLNSGFSSRAGSPFGSGGSPYETGLNGLAPGGVAGGGSDVITPLNVRDPSALVMGPGATQQPPAGAAPQAPSAPAPKEDDSKWKDAIAAGKAGASAATKKAGLPVPKVPLSAGGLRGLGAISGGSGASGSNLPIGPAAGSSRPTGSNALTGTKGSGFQGSARGPGSGAGGAFENLKKNAAAAGADLNRSGSAATALETAANRDMGAGGGGGAGQGSGKDDKGSGQSQSKDSKSSGDACSGTLEAKLRCQNAEERMKLDWKKKEKMEMLPLNLMEDSIKTLVGKGIMEPLAAGMADLIGGFGQGAATQLKCTGPNGQGERTMKRPPPCGKPQDTVGFCSLPRSQGGGVQGPGGIWNCSEVGGDAALNTQNTGAPVQNVPATTNGTTQQRPASDDCSWASQIVSQPMQSTANDPIAGRASDQSRIDVTQAQGVCSAATKLVTARRGLDGAAAQTEVSRCIAACRTVPGT